MACRTIAAGPGITAIVCGGRGARAACSVPGCVRPHTKLCDHPVDRKGKVGTCDAKLCDRCTVAAGPDRDLCPPHARQVSAAAPPPPTPAGRGDR